MKLTIVYGGIFYEKTKKLKEIIELDRDQVSVKDLIELLFVKYPELGQVFNTDPLQALTSSMIIINKKLVSQNQEEVANVKLIDGDEIHLMPIIHGG